MNKVLKLFSCAAMFTLLVSSCIVPKKKLTEANKRTEQERAENAKLKNKVAALEDRVNKQNASIGQLNGSVDALKASISALNARIARLKDSIKDGEEQKDALQGRLSRLGDEKQSTAKELNATKDQIAAQKRTMEAEIEGQRRRMEKDLADQRKTLEDQIAMQREQMAKLQSFIDQQQKATEDLRKKIAEALSGFTSNELTVTRKNGKVYISMQEGLLFPSGSAVVNKKGKDALSKVASVLNTNADINIDVEGHTDSLAIHNKTYADNWDLSTARATSIAHVLIDEYKVSPAKLVASGRSQYDPLATNTTPEGRAANRRTEIILEPKLDEIMQMLNGK